MNLKPDGAPLPAPRQPRYHRLPDGEIAPAGTRRFGVAVARLRHAGTRLSTGVRRSWEALTNRLPRPIGAFTAGRAWRRQVVRLAVPLMALLAVLSVAGIFHHLYFHRSGLPGIEPFIRFEPPAIGEVFDNQGILSSEAT